MLLYILLILVAAIPYVLFCRLLLALIQWLDRH